MDPDYIIDYNENLKDFANDMRKSGTKAEACLWKYVLRAKQMKGYAFNRQRPVISYIADFMCKPLKLIIEVDGSTHENEEVKKKDKIKENDLVANGYTVLRFTDNDVLRNIEIVQKEIEAVIDRLEQKVKAPPPSAKC